VNRVTKTFDHNDEEERRERVSLSKSSRRGKGARRNTIDKDGEKCPRRLDSKSKSPRVYQSQRQGAFPACSPSLYY
jgi:hypothetical protein